MKEFTAVGRRCAVDLHQMSQIARRSVSQVLSTLDELGFSIVEVDLSEVAQGVLGCPYKKGSLLSDAPKEFDCSSLATWLYGQCGILIPGLALLQREAGQRVCSGDLRPWDLLFRSRRAQQLFAPNSGEGVGHVGIMLPSGRVLHSSYVRGCVVDARPDLFMHPDRARGVVRISDMESLTTLRVPSGVEITTSSEVLKLVLSRI